MIDKNSLWIMLGLSNIFVLGEIRRVLKDENLVEEFKNKFTEYGIKTYEEYLIKRKEVIESLPDESLKKGLERLLNRIYDRIICFGKEDIDRNLPVNTLECITGAYVEMSILDAIYPHIKARNYNKVREVISYLSSEDVSKKIFEAFRNIRNMYALRNRITDILEEKKDIDGYIKELDRAFKYAYNYIVGAIEDLFYNRKENFLEKIEYGTKLDPYKEIRHQIKEILKEAFGSHS